MKRYAQLSELETLVGQVIGESGWVEVDQSRIDRFAEATGDRQWIHTDPARAALGPFGATVAHGFLTLSLIPAMVASAYAIDGIRMGVNYGLNRVRFPSPVPAGSRLKAHFTLQAFEQIPAGAQLTLEAQLLREGADKPVCVAESVFRYYP